MNTTAAEKLIARMDLNWDGMLTTKNIDKVAELLHQLLDGKKYTFVAANEIRSFRPEVVTDTRLKPEKTTTGKAINVHHHSKGHASLNIIDSKNVLPLSTSLEEEIYDSSFKNPYFVFEYDKVTITLCASGGNKIFWVLAVQKESAK